VNAKPTLLWPHLFALLLALCYDTFNFRKGSSCGGGCCSNNSKALLLHPKQLAFRHKSLIAQISEAIDDEVFYLYKYA